MNEVGGALATTIRNCRFLDDAELARRRHRPALRRRPQHQGRRHLELRLRGQLHLRANNNEGGAIYKYHYRTAWISDCTFTGNRAYMGGAIRDYLGDLVVKRSTFATADVAGVPARPSSTSARTRAT